MTSRKVVIIGAGIVGTNVADELSCRGWTDITVVEQGPLQMPGGSTSHAPGLVFQTNPSQTMTRFAKYTVEKLSSLEKDGQSCFNPVGGLEIATTPARVQELKRKHGYASSWGIQARLIGVEECSRLYPPLSKHRILAALHIPSDGLALAARAVQLLIERTRRAGVRYLESTLVTGVDQSNGHVTGVSTNHGSIPADIVISCAGFWGVEIGKMVNLPIPLLPLAHQYVKTGPVKSLAAKNPLPNSARLPILRHQDQDLYYREHGDHFGIGYYGHRPMPVDASALGPTARDVDHQNMPSRLQFTHDDFAPAWRESQELLPELRSVQITDAFNGIFSFTPDGAPIVGEHPTLSGFHVAEAVWVTHSAGVARAVAEYLTYGKSNIDLGECNLDRFDEIQLTREYVKTTSEQNFVEVYDIIHPLDQRSSPRNLRVSPFSQRQQELGVVLVEGLAWERPHFYKSNLRLVRELLIARRLVERDAWSARHYSPAVAVEAWKTATAVALYDLTPLRRLELSGPGAVDLLQHLCSIDVRGPHGVARYALLLDEDGGIRSEITIHKHGRNNFMIECNGNPDLVYFRKKASSLAKTDPTRWTQVRDTTAGTCCIGLWGPSASDLLSKAASPRLRDSHVTHGRITRLVISGIPAVAARLSYVGDSGWQIYTSADLGQSLWDALWMAGQSYGIIPAGRAAFNALRIEQGFKFWGADMNAEHNPYQSGLDWAIDKAKTGYVGYAALAGCRRNVVRHLVTLTVDDGRSMIMGKEPVFHQDRPVGYITSAAFGYSIGKPIAFAWLCEDVDSVEVEYFGRRIPASVERTIDRQRRILPEVISMAEPRL